MMRGQAITARTSATNRAAPAGKCQGCKRDLSETKARKSGIKDPRQQWMRRCDCGITNFYPRAH